MTEPTTNILPEQLHEPAEKLANAYGLVYLAIPPQGDVDKETNDTIIAGLFGLMTEVRDFMKAAGHPMFQGDLAGALPHEEGKPLVALGEDGPRAVSVDEAATMMATAGLDDGTGAGGQVAAQADDGDDDEATKRFVPPADDRPPLQSYTREGVLAIVIQLTADYLSKPVENVKESHHFVSDLGADSLDSMELQIKFANQFLDGSDKNFPEDAFTVGAVVDHIMAERKRLGLVDRLIAEREKRGLTDHQGIG